MLSEKTSVALQIVSTMPGSTVLRLQCCAKHADCPIPQGSAAWINSLAYLLAHLIASGLISAKDAWHADRKKYVENEMDVHLEGNHQANRCGRIFSGDDVSYATLVLPPL